jgi:hypothetical protein
VYDSSNSKDAFAFDVDLQSQLATVQLEDRLIIHRSLDRDFPIGPTAFFVCGQQITTETSEFGALSIGAVSELNIETHWEADQQKS